MRFQLASHFTLKPGFQGLNEFKLKLGFKQQFGTTVRAYLIRFRLNKAQQLLLLDTSYPVGEVAALVGYKNGAHFTAAFGEKFGLLPSALARNEGPVQRFNP